MKENKLSDNGIEKLLGSITGIIVQALAVAKKVKNNQNYYSCQLSDGFCKLKSCLIVDEEIFTKNKLFQNQLIIAVNRCMINNSRAQKLPVIVVENYSIVTDQVKNVVGNPMAYDEYLKKGKTNPQGDNKYKLNSKEEKQKNKYQDLLDDQETQTHPIPQSKPSKTNELKPPQKNQVNPSKQPKGNLKLSGDDESKPLPAKNNSLQRQTKLTNIPNRPKVEESPSNRNRSLNQNENKNKNRNAPIEKIKPKNSPAVRGNQKKPVHEYNEIRNLFPGMENFVLLGRVLFVNKMKSFINKKGVESSLLSIEIGDKSGTIECTMFGDTAQKFEGNFVEDNIYEISNASIIENTYMGVHTLRVTIGEQTKVCLREDDDPSVPLSQDFCLTIKQLITVPVGQTVRVICLIKDEAQVEDFVSKAGKNVRKKIVLYCDPKQKLQVEVIYWNQKCDDTFEMVPYMVKGIKIGQFNGNRQYSLANTYSLRPIKHHPLRKYIKEIENIQFTNPDSQNKNKKKRTMISNLKELNSAMEQENPKGTWSEMVCSIATIKTTNKPYYLSCPNCKKKVNDQFDGQCPNCYKAYEQARPRYIMQMLISDNFDSIWVNAYDDVATIITGISAPEFAKLSEEDIQDLIKAVRFRVFKVKLVTKEETFMNEARKKTSIIKVLDLNYAEESKTLLNKLQYMVRGE